MPHFLTRLLRRTARTLNEILDPDGANALREIRDLEAWRPLGSYVQFAGQLARVKGHYCPVEPLHFGLRPLRPGLLLEVRLDTGQTIPVRLGRTMSLTLMREQPARVGPP
jgi:hypothetical protein